MTETRLAPGRIIALFAFIYLISYITRTNFGAIVSEMVAQTGHMKSTLSAALTGSFITYGAGQLVSGYFGDRIQPKKLVMLGLIVTSLCNLTIAFCISPLAMTVIWCINGFAQAFMWPPIVKLMASLLSSRDYDRGCVRVAQGGSCGTMLLYLFSPLLILLFGWKSVFLVSALVGFLGLLLWLRLCPDIDMPQKSAVQKRFPRRFPITHALLAILFAILLQGVLRDGVSTWMPSYISETYRLTSEIAILTGVLLPVFSICCHQFTLFVYHKLLRNPLLCAGALFGVGAVCALLLWLFAGHSAACSVLFAALLSGSMHGVNMMLVCILPPLIAKKDSVSTISGVVNACTYIGSALSAYVIPLSAELAGWHTSVLLWLLCAAVGTLICLLCIPAGKKMQS